MRYPTKLTTVTALVVIFTTASIVSIIFVDYQRRHCPPNDWVQLAESMLSEDPSWAGVKSAKVGFNGYNIFLDIEWNNPMTAAPNEWRIDSNGNTILVYGGIRGVDATLRILNSIEYIRIEQINEDYYWENSAGIRRVTQLPSTQGMESKKAIFEVELVNLLDYTAWLNSLNSSNITAWFTLQTIAESSSLARLLQNESHVISIDGELTDWPLMSNISLALKPITLNSELGAINSVFGMFSSNGLALAMNSTHPFQELPTLYPELNVESTFIFALEAFQESPTLLEHSYNPNLFWSITDGLETKHNIIYHIWDVDEENTQGETFTISQNQWQVNTSVEVLLEYNDIIPLTTFQPIDYYYLSVFTEIRWWQTT